MAGHYYNGRELELLIPASSLEVLKIAVIFGADAVYIGGEAFGLRAKAKNFSKEDMIEGIKFAHERDVKVYVTANILAHNYDLDGAREYFKELDVIKPDAVIISDPGMFTIAKEELHDIDIHISTQANNTNYMTYQFWWKQGAKRVVTARELSLNEIRNIRKNIPDEMEIETFIHGAMCISYSGRCLLSSFMAGRDANRGACTHPCRWKYAVVEENRPGEYMPVYENERGTYIFNSKDLCMIEHIPELIEAGIDSFKIEGRMKTALYVATVARTYRLAIDDFLKDPELYKSRIPFYKSEIQKCTYRQYTTGFFFGKPDENTQIYDSNTYLREYTYLGIIGECNEEGLYHIEQRNKFSVGETIEVMKPNGDNLEVVVKTIKNDLDTLGTKFVEGITTFDSNTYDDEIMQKYFALSNKKTDVNSADEINNFEKLKAVVEDMEANKDALGIQGVFASTSMASGNAWRWETHLANLPLYYEFKDDAGENGDVIQTGIDAKEIDFKYNENYKNIYDLYTDNSVSEKGILGNKSVDDSMAEFALGDCAMVQNGNWAWSQINDINGNTVKAENIKFMSIYTGIKGEENQGICIGTENYLAINSQVSEEKQQASIDFINWLFTSDTGKAYVSGDLGFIAPFDTFNDDEKPEDPLSKEVINWMSKDNINTVPWVFQAFPSQNFKDTFASALLEYVQGTQDWNYVVNTVKDSWKAEKAQ